MTFIEVHFKAGDIIKKNAKSFSKLGSVVWGSVRNSKISSANGANLYAQTAIYCYALKVIICSEAAYKGFQCILLYYYIS